MPMFRLVLALSALIAATAAAAPQVPSAADWPQWRGPRRDGISRETGLLRQWPSAGPPTVWSRADLGEGYGSIAVVADRVFVQGARSRQSSVSALSRTDGRVLWTRGIGSSGNNDRGPGPRATPTVDGDRLYALTENGDLACLRVADGTVVWQRNILRDFRARNISWLLSESPLVDGARVIVTPGGPGAGMAALDKMTGATVWTTKELSDEAGYSSPIVADVQGVRTIMTLTAEAGVGVRASDGKLMWRNTSPANGTANATTPVFQDDKVFYTSSYGAGGTLLGLTAQGGEVRARQVYSTQEMQNHHGGVIVLDGHLYGFHNSILAALEFATGRTVWRDRSVGKGALTFADGHFYIVGENQVVGLVEASSSGYREKGRFRLADQGWPTWAHPVVSGGRLYIRNQGTLTAYDVRAAR